MGTGVLTREDRVALARAALARAEQRTGARTVRLGEPDRAVMAEAAVAVRRTDVGTAGARPAEVRVAAVDRSAVDRSAGGLVAVEVDLGAVGVALDDHAPVGVAAAPARTHQPRSLLTTERPPLPVPPELVPVLPDGLRRGATTVVTGSTSLVLALVAHACAGGSWAAVVGQPSIGLLAAAQAGIALERLAVVPHPGADAATVLAALVDGLDVVLVGPEVSLGDADRRRLSARARDRGVVLLASVPWPGAGVVLTVQDGRWSGVGTGDGRLRTHCVRITRAGRGSAAVPRTLEVTLPFGVAHDDPVVVDTAATPATTTATTILPAAEVTDVTAEAGPTARPELRLVG